MIFSICIAWRLLFKRTSSVVLTVLNASCSHSTDEAATDEAATGYEADVDLQFYLLDFFLLDLELLDV